MWTLDNDSESSPPNKIVGKINRLGKLSLPGPNYLLSCNIITSHDSVFGLIYLFLHCGFPKDERKLWAIKRSSEAP